tara:strand:- start:17896 stop:18237 length:342 start_codon:yes stop_codon:yes gene_type:complete
MIKPPNWAPNSIPTYDGWINPENNELLVRSPAGGFSEKQISDYMDEQSNYKMIDDTPMTKIAVEEIVAKTYVKTIDKMNKLQLTAYASEHGIEDLDGLTKKEIIAKIKEAGVS